jgi:hypothetical protein
MRMPQKNGRNQKRVNYNSGGQKHSSTNSSTSSNIATNPYSQNPYGYKVVKNSIDLSEYTMN